MRLCNVDTGRGVDNPPVIAFQRYGRGTVVPASLLGRQRGESTPRTAEGEDPEE